MINLKAIPNTNRCHSRHEIIVSFADNTTIFRCPML